MTFYNAKPLLVVSGIIFLVAAFITWAGVPAITAGFMFTLLNYGKVLGGLFYWGVFAFSLWITYDLAIDSLKVDMINGRKGQWFSAICVLLQVAGIGTMYYVGVATHGTWLWWPTWVDAGIMAAAVTVPYVLAFFIGIYMLVRK